jgi:CheY-like chemotaxis protein
MNPHDNTILLAEDDPNDAKLIRRALVKARCANPLQTVSDGEQAIAYLSGTAPYEDRQQHPLPILLLLDLKMPKKNGFDVLHWIRSQPILKRLPVVVLTSSSVPQDVNKAYEAGSNSYLVKPVDSEALVDMLKTIELYWIVSNVRPDLTT